MLKAANCLLPKLKEKILLIKPVLKHAATTHKRGMTISLKSSSLTSLTTVSLLKLSVKFIISRIKIIYTL